MNRIYPGKHNEPGLIVLDAHSDDFSPRSEKCPYIKAKHIRIGGPHIK